MGRAVPFTRTSTACRPGRGFRVVCTASDTVVLKSAEAFGASTTRPILKTFGDVMPLALTK